MALPVQYWNIMSGLQTKNSNSIVQKEELIYYEILKMFVMELGFSIYSKL
jgi:hypothetical protein